jgi:hypothetical protein
MRIQRRNSLLQTHIGRRQRLEGTINATSYDTLKAVPHRNRAFSANFSPFAGIACILSQSFVKGKRDGLIYDLSRTNSREPVRLH